MEGSALVPEMAQRPQGTEVTCAICGFRQAGHRSEAFRPNQTDSSLS